MAIPTLPSQEQDSAVRPTVSTEQSSHHLHTSAKPRPRKLQRGQKQPKVSKAEKSASAEEAEEPAVSTALKGGVLTIDIHDEIDELSNQDQTELPQKKTRKSRKRKDGYDPGQLAPEITIPSAGRMKAIAKTTIQSGHAVSRPQVKSGLDKRQSQINQLKRRYGDSLIVSADTENFVFPFVPSDPDFPYELPELKIRLTVPASYPKLAANLMIHSGLEPGFARNIERAFVVDKIGFGYGGRGIMGMLTWLDRNIERLLGMKKSETVKIIRHQAGQQDSSKDVAPTKQVDSIVSSRPSRPTEYSASEVREAALARNMALSKLRMIHPSKLNEESFDLDLNSATKIRLQVPKVFPLQPAWLMVLKGDDSIEETANEVLRENTRGLPRTINWLASNLDKLHPKATQVTKVPEPALQATQASKDSSIRVPEHAEVDGFVLVADQVYSVADNNEGPQDEDYSSGDDHVGVSDFEDDFEHLTMNDAKQESSVTKDTPGSKSNTTTQTQEKGTAINATISLTHISLLEPISLSLNLKCLRCKSTGNHIASVLSSKSAEVQCPTCSSLLSVKFRGQALHQANSRIGYLDLVGASVLDLGPGTFSPTCEKCDVVGVAFKGLVAGQPQTRPCRACFIKQTVSITTTSFLVINSAVKAAGQGSREAQNLNLQRGKPLPNNGVCKHYRKSNRWFRFSCCNKVYACDLCHETLTDHPMELARFQICGWCSKESAIRGLKPCVHCGRDLTRRSRGGFWEGGQGTRDQSKMNRNDPRKHRKKI